MKKYVLGILTVLSVNSYAVTSSGWRTIEKIGCHNVDNTCYVYLSGNAVGPQACTSTSLRWNKESDPNGDAMLSLLMAAFYSESKVNFGIKSTCYTNQPGFPTINHIDIEK